MSSWRALVAATIRGPHIRALGLGVGGRAQVSMNLVAPTVVGPAAAYDLVAGLAEVDGGELVGLVPAASWSRYRSRAGRSSIWPPTARSRPACPAAARSSARR